MNMKKMIFLIAMAITATMPMMAQQQQNVQKKQKETRQRLSPEQMQQMRIKHLINDLALDDATAAKFTEIYKDYSKEMGNIRKSYHAKGDKKKELTDAEIDAQTKTRFQQSRKIIDVREKYYERFRKVLTARQTKKIFDMEQRMGRSVKGKMMKRR